MYGTIFNLNVKPGHEADIMNELNVDIRPGMVAWFLMRPDDSNADLIGVAIFESKEAYLANANSPEQHQAFTQVMKHLTAEPSWTDGEYVIGAVASDTV